MTTAANLPTSLANVRSAQSTLDLQKIRRDFPILARDVRGKKLV